MNLLDALRQYISDASPRGLLNPEVPEDAPQEVAKGLLGLTPGVGDAISGYDAIQSARAGNYGEAALNGIGLLPFVPALGGMVNPLKREARAAYKANQEVFDNAHKSQDLKFTSIPIAELGDAVRIHRSAKYGNKAPSEYLVGIINGEPAYIRKSDHWGEFSTNVHEGTPDAAALGFANEIGDQFGRVGYKRHNWELLGGISSQHSERIKQLEEAMSSMRAADQNWLLSQDGQKLWDELYALKHPRKREAGYIPLSSLLKK